jgi:RNA polymerase sigma factor (sigma-70 family)
VDTPARETFEALVRQYGRLVLAAVGRVAGRGGAGLGEDIAQEVLLALWKQVEREQSIEHPASYVYKAAVRATVRIVRRERRRATEPLSENEAAESAAGSRADDPHAALEGRERSEQLEAGLGALAVDRARAVRAHLSGFDAREIMELYGWTYQKTRNLVARGMADLRSELRARGIHG